MGGGDNGEVVSIRLITILTQHYRLPVGVGDRTWASTWVDIWEQVSANLVYGRELKRLKTNNKQNFEKILNSL